MTQHHSGELLAGSYRLGKQLGVGGMASVFEAFDGTGQRVAIKLLNESLRTHPTVPRRFVQEAQAMRALSTPHAVKVEGAGMLDDGTPYLVMEYLEGVDLGTLARRSGGKLEIERALSLADQIAAALQEAHAHGIVHRDLKPDNVLVIDMPSGEMVKVLDFGIAKRIDTQSEGLTTPGTTVGTPHYMPLEQLRGDKNLDGRVDVYALGVVLYELLSGIRPFEGITDQEVIQRAMSVMPPPLSSYRSDVPAGLDRVVAAAMARSRDDRIGSMRALREALWPFWSGKRPDFAQNAGPNSTRPSRPSSPASSRSVGVTLPMTAVFEQVPPSGMRNSNAPLVQPMARKRGHALLWIVIVVSAVVLGGGAACAWWLLAP